MLRSCIRFDARHSPGVSKSLAPNGRCVGAITRHPIEVLVPRMWFLRQNITAYDASYVALAESLNLPLITRDARLARSTGHAARIEYIA
ncbi:MAG TPA: type II toxin-antitoxin system VapC family toxin [Thermoanaerobaculia bacterium]|nr:type II toxin-antitoxin system VapC family toxin [Thermoanaerobaculia bacterium]